MRNSCALHMRVSHVFDLSMYFMSLHAAAFLPNHGMHDVTSTLILPASGPAGSTY